MEVLIAENLHRFFNENKEVLSSLVPEELQHAMGCSNKSCPKPSNSEVKPTKNNFEATLDVQHFKPEEISVITSEKTIIVEAKQNERQDEFGSISRHIVRRYLLPEEYDIEKAESKLSLDGVLTISAPKVNKEPEGCRIIPVMRTGAISQMSPL